MERLQYSNATPTNAVLPRRGHYSGILAIHWQARLRQMHLGEMIIAQTMAVMLLHIDTK